MRKVQPTFVFLAMGTAERKFGPRGRFTEPASVSEIIVAGCAEEARIELLDELSRRNPPTEGFRKYRASVHEVSQEELIDMAKWARPQKYIRAGT
jgi:hypothetical protein